MVVVVVAEAVIVRGWFDGGSFYNLISPCTQKIFFGFILWCSSIIVWNICACGDIFLSTGRKLERTNSTEARMDQDVNKEDRGLKHKVLVVKRQKL